MHQKTSQFNFKSNGSPSATKMCICSCTLLRTLTSDGSVNVDFFMSFIQGFQCRNIVKGEIETWDTLQPVRFPDMQNHCRSDKMVSSYGDYWSFFRAYWYFSKFWYGMMKEDICRAARRKGGNRGSDAETRWHGRYMGRMLEKRGIFSVQSS